MDSRSFRNADHVRVERGLAEFRAGRPVAIESGGGVVLAVPADGAGQADLAAFRALCAPASPQLVISAPRARSLGMVTDRPLAIELAQDDGPDEIRGLSTAGRIDRAIVPVADVAAIEAALKLAKLALRLPALLFAAVESVPVADPPILSVTVGGIENFRQHLVASLAIAGEANVPLRGDIAARFVVFRDDIGGSRAALVVGTPDFSGPVLVRLHSACLTGDVFGSRRCDCGDQLRLALDWLKAGSGGIILYLDQEGRGLGLSNKMLAYALQDAGLDTVDANTTLGFYDDERDYDIAARMLKMLGCERILLLTNNPAKIDGLAEAGITVAGRVPLNAPVNADNRRYLAAKARRAGHLLEGVVPDADLSEEKRLPTAAT